MAMNGCSNALGVNAWPFSVFTSTKNFRRISVKSVGLTVLRFLDRSFLLPTQLLSWCFWLELFAQFHPVARCLNPSFDMKKAKTLGLLPF